MSFFIWNKTITEKLILFHPWVIPFIQIKVHTFYQHVEEAKCVLGLLAQGLLVRQFCGNPTVAKMGAGKTKIKILRTYRICCCTIFLQHSKTCIKVVLYFLAMTLRLWSKRIKRWKEINSGLLLILYCSCWERKRAMVSIWFN